jgi:hypothetical protein
MPFTMSARLACVAQHTYKIEGSTNNLAVTGSADLLNSACVGYLGTVAARESVGHGIDAALVGVIEEGVVVGVRGTLSPDSETRQPLEILADWMNDMGVVLTPGTFETYPFPGNVHGKFEASFCRLWDEVSALVAQRATDAPKRIYITGHSKGGAMCALFAWALSHQFPDHKIIVRAFAPARVGGGEFANAYNARIKNHVRFEFDDDPVPHLPIRTALAVAVGFDEKWAKLLTRVDPGYDDVGKLCYINENLSLRIPPPDFMEWRLQRLRARLSGNPIQAFKGLVRMLGCHAMKPGYSGAHYHTLPVGFADDLPPV